MNRRPDVIRTLVMVFAVGLLISGITSLAASDNRSEPSAAQMVGGDYHSGHDCTQ
jgi:hypothetical protein